MSDPYAHRPWLGEYPREWAVDLPPRYTDMLSALEAAASATPSRPFLAYFNWQGTFATVDAESDRVAAGFAADGVRQGDRVAIIGQNTPMFAEAVLACWKLGAIPIPGNPMYRAGELARILADAAPALCVCEQQVSETVAAALAQAGLASVPVATFSPWSRGEGDKRALPARGTADVAGPREASSATPPFRRHRPEPDELGLILYTSGTTGRPKGVMLTHRSIAFNAQAMGDWGGVERDSIVLGMAPLFHITGFVSHLCLAIVAQARLVLTYRFEPGVVLDAIRRERPTYTVAAITAFNALMNAPGATREDFRSLTAAYSGGAAIPPSMVTDLRVTLGIDVRPCYGMTETCSPTHAAIPGKDVPVDGDAGALAIGVPTFSTEARVVDDAGRPVAVGAVGELWLRGPQIMQGYWGQPEETAAALSEGWMKSGDVGFMDKRGWFYIVDRKKDMINASGFKVWPREVEDCLYEHKAVREAAVIGVPDAYRGETVLAFVACKAGIRVGEAGLIAHCRARLAAYKCPRSVRIVDELPKTATGKIQRHALRDAAVGSG